MHVSNVSIFFLFGRPKDIFSAKQPYSPMSPLKFTVTDLCSSQNLRLQCEYQSFPISVLPLLCTFFVVPLPYTADLANEVLVN